MSETLAWPAAGRRGAFRDGHVVLAAAGPADLRDAADAARCLTRLGLTATVVDASPAGDDRDAMAALVLEARCDLLAATDADAALAGVGHGGPVALAAAAALGDDRLALPFTLLWNARLAGWRPVGVPVRVPALLLMDRDAAWRERRDQRRVARELGAGSRLVVVRSLARNGEAILRDWRPDAAASPVSPGLAARRVAAGLAGAAVAIAPAVAAAPAGAAAQGRVVTSAHIAGDGLGGGPVAKDAAKARAARRRGGKRVGAARISGDGLHASLRATGSQALIGGGFKFFVNTDITFSTSSSASAGMSEASATHAVEASTSGGGTVESTVNDAFDGYNTMAVHVGPGAPAGPPQTGTAAWTIYNKNGLASTSCAGREVVFPDQAAGALTMSRRVWVPTGSPVARWLNVFTNTGATPLTVHMATGNNLGSDANTRIFATSSGDTTATTADTWVGTFQNWSGTTSTDPRIGHVFQGAGAATPASGVSFADGDDSPYWTYDLTIQPGQTQIVADYVALGGTKTGVEALAGSLAASPPTDCMTAGEQAEVVNFALGSGGGGAKAPVYPAPVITGLSRDSGSTAGGETVVIHGTNFTGSSRVMFGDVPAASVRVDRYDQITAVAPPHAEGAVTIQVLTASGGSPTNAGAYTYVAPPPAPAPVVAPEQPVAAPSRSKPAKHHAKRHHPKRHHHKRHSKKRHG